MRVARADDPASLETAPLLHREADRIAGRHAGGAQEQDRGAGEVLAVAGARGLQELPEGRPVPGTLALPE